MQLLNSPCSCSSAPVCWYLHHHRQMQLLAGSFQEQLLVMQEISIMFGFANYSYVTNDACMRILNVEIDEKGNTTMNEITHCIAENRHVDECIGCNGYLNSPCVC